MKILVTGAAGFIGFHVSRTLVKIGVTVVGIDNINSYYDPNLKYNRLLQLGVDIKSQIKENQELGLVTSTTYDHFSFLKVDITNLEALETLFKVQDFTCVIHLAAQAGVRHSIKNPHAYIQSNVVCFLNILECCRNNKIDHLIYASSSSVYGNRSIVPFSEKEKVDSPVSLYAATKKSNELMAHSYSHLYDLRTTGLRFFTVYGPWGRPDMAPMLFATAINKGETINVFNNGEMQRDFTYIDDVVEGVVKLALEAPKTKIKKAEIFNIGNAKPVALLDFIGGLEDAMGKKADKNFMPMQDGDVKITYADSSKLQKAVGYKPTTSLQDGLQSFVKWFKGYYEN
ncbi:NAD-dependent epimerase/dehydratase family protein [uncultured Maribacter sp.]|uniref:NAD-dependent epimerase/dehydratase family protein n=1 Tax=uncultured Maribacter sp. TaxID=431308 RepID=UPI0026034878|nr:NAD-dependent epimerase/dehydratase family protein [uncultured Maribacter sp.]